MDLVLDISDSLVFDKVYANLVPLSAFVSAIQSHNSSSSIPIIAPVSTWSHLVSYLPHPSLPPDDILSSYASSATQSAATAISAWPRDYILRQLLTLTVLTSLGILFLYFFFAWLSFKYIFNHEMMRHPKFLKDQVRLEIMCSLRAFPGMIALTLPWFLAEVRGHTKLYENVDDYGWFHLIASVPIFLLFTDFCIYWAHRWLHWPTIYRALHKPHHKWIIPSPFASHAFHPVDGYIQSLPYHIIIYVLPMHRILYLAMFVFVNCWSILIHDSDMITGHPLETIINGPAHHTLHHMYFTVNYGQYFTWADRVGNSYRQPSSALDPLRDIKPIQSSQEKKQQ